MTERRFYYIEDMAAILGKSVSAIYGHLTRKQYDAVPPPMKLGRRLVWLIEAVEDWIELKAVSAKADIERHADFIQSPPRRRGRPTKAEERQARNEFEKVHLVNTLVRADMGEDVEFE